MTQKLLLLAIDGSVAGQAAVDFTIGFATMSEAQVAVLHVRELPASLRVPPLETTVEASALVEGSVARINRAGVPADGMIYSAREPNVARCIVETADEYGCNAIALGSLRRRGLHRLTGRNIREQVMRRSALPVIVAPPALYPATPNWPAEFSRPGAA